MPRSAVNDTWVAPLANAAAMIAWASSPARATGTTRVVPNGPNSTDAPSASVSDVEVVHDSQAASQQIEEACRVDAGGTVVVSFTNLTAGYVRDYRLGHWGERGEPLKPGRRRKPAASKAGKGGPVESRAE